MEWFVRSNFFYTGPCIRLYSLDTGRANTDLLDMLLDSIWETAFDPRKVPVQCLARSDGCYLRPNLSGG
jgi:hypothetical protein